MKMISSPQNIEIYLPPEIREEPLKDKDYYEKDEIFGAPQKSIWEYIQRNAKFLKIFNEGQLIHEALLSIKNKNFLLKVKLEQQIDENLKRICFPFASEEI